MPLLLGKRQIQAKIESTGGTYATPADSDLFWADNIVWTPEAKMHDRASTSDKLGKLPKARGAMKASLTFDMFFMGTGAAYSSSVLPEVSVPLLACGFSETIDTTGGSETVTYAPTSTLTSYFSFRVLGDGVAYDMAGCQGNVVFTAKVGEMFKASFTISGTYISPTDVALVPPASGEYETDVSPPTYFATNSLFSVTAPQFLEWSIDMGNVVTMRPAGQTSYGYLTAQITNRNPTFKVDPESTLVATQDWWDWWESETQDAITLGNIGSTQYNKFTTTVAKAQITGIAPGDREGVEVLNIDGMVLGLDGSGDPDEGGPIFLFS